MTTLGGQQEAVAPATATRATRPGWRDPRLWVGVLVVAVSVVAGARLFAAADDTVTVWATRDDLAVGDEVTAEDLEPRQVRFADGADLGRYLTADEPLPEEARLLRGVGEGELLPRAALGAAEDTGVLQLPISVDPTLVPGSVGAGSVVSVYVRDTAPCAACRGAALEGVTVVDAPTTDELTGTRQLVLAVEQQEADAWFALLAGLESPVVTVTAG